MEQNNYGPKNWKYTSNTSPGFHNVISPENSPCKVTYIFRLNLEEGTEYQLSHNELELNAAVIEGKVAVSHNTEATKLGPLDSFYLPAREMVTITAIHDSIIFIGGGPYEGIGSFFTRIYSSEWPLGAVHQIHGEPPYKRFVFMTIDQDTPASRLICGLTWGEPGKWTSWPPHQHTKDLEEVYCYFGVPAPFFALHLASRTPEKIEAIHPVQTGDCVVVPEGYHPTVGTPEVRSCYFWVMVAHSHESRRYDLAKSDFFPAS